MKKPIRKNKYESYILPQLDIMQQKNDENDSQNMWGNECHKGVSQY